MIFVLPYPPSANEYWRWDKRGFMRVSTKALAYKRNVALLCKAAGVRPIKGAVSLKLSVYRPRKAGDLSNRVKVLEDALIGSAYGDDDQVTHLEATRYDDASNPRVVVTVEEA